MLDFLHMLQFHSINQQPGVRRENVPRYKTAGVLHCGYSKDKGLKVLPALGNLKLKELTTLLTSSEQTS